MEPSPRPAEAGPATSGSTLIRLEGRDALRLLHRAAVAVTSDGVVWLARHDAPAGELLAHLDRLVFRDEVRVAEAGAGRIVRPLTRGVTPLPGTLSERDGAPLAIQIAPDFGLAVEPGAPREIDPEEERARILAGRPRHGHEVDPAFNPFEVGLSHEVHLDKGCFTGQEALMR